MDAETDISLAYWQELLSKVEVINPTEDEWSHLAIDIEWEHLLITELDNIERNEGVVFPSGYKAFCQVFGSGTFGEEFISINCPTDFFLKQLVPAQLEGMRIALAYSPEKKVRDNLRFFSELLDSSFIFGGYDHCVAFWDLRTYDKLDDSYDIYWALTDLTQGDAYKVGRKFSDFIRQFCLSDLYREVLPSELHHPFEGTISPTFRRTPFIPNSEDGTLL